MVSWVGCKWFLKSRNFRIIVAFCFMSATILMFQLKSSQKGFALHQIKDQLKNNQTRFVIQELTEELLRIENFQLRVKEREKAIKQIDRYCQATIKNRKKKFPKAIGIGVKKCGTDGLIRFLSHHPLVKLPEQISSEAFFFNRKSQGHSLEYYRSLFPMINENEMTMEKTPQYFDDLPYNLPENIAKSLPGVKLLLVVCEPAKRVFSEFVHERSQQQLFGPSLLNDISNFDAYVNVTLQNLKEDLADLDKKHATPHAIQRKLSSFYRTDLSKLLITTGLYFFHMQRWMTFFNEGNLMIIDGERFVREPGPIIEEVQEFLGLSKLVWKQDFAKNLDTGFFCYRKITTEYLVRKSANSTFLGSLQCLSKTKGRTRMKSRDECTKSTLQKLKQFYKPYNEKFNKLVQKKFYWN